VPGELHALALRRPARESSLRHASALTPLAFARQPVTAALHSPRTRFKLAGMVRHGAIQITVVNVVTALRVNAASVSRASEGRSVRVVRKAASGRMRRNLCAAGPTGPGRRFGERLV
jgi:hypothetical protein